MDRLVSRANMRQRLTESIETALELTGGTAEVLVDGRQGRVQGPSEEAITFSQHLSCTHCGISFEEPAPRSFSFNSPYGACPVCLGLGTKFEVDPELVVPDESLSLAEGALAPWAGARSEYFTGLQVGVAELGGFDFDAPGSRSRPRTRSSSSTGRAPHGPRHLQEPLQPQALVRGGVRGHHPVAAAPARRGRVGLVARADRGLHARGGLPGVRGRPAQARVAGRHRRRAQHRRAVQPVDRQRRRGHGDAGAERPRAHDRRPRLQGSPRAHAVPARRRARLPLAGPLGRHAVGRRGPADPSGQPDRQRPGRRALRARRALHRPAPARQPAPDRHAGAAAQPGQHRHRGGARRGDHPHRRLRGRHRARGGGARRQRRPRRPGHRGAGAADQQGVDHRAVPVGQEVDPRAGPAPPGDGRRRDGARRPGAQPQGRRRVVPARAA